MRKSLQQLAMVIATAALVTACGTSNDAANNDMNDTAMMSASGTMGPMASPDVAGVVAVANSGEIEQAQAALPNLTSNAARDFANMMIADHTRALNEGQSVFAANNIVPRESNQPAMMLHDQSNQMVMSLKNATGSADQAYMQGQVDVHQRLLTMIDTELIPASRGELLSLLQKQRTSVAMHLDHARQILTGLR